MDVERADERASAVAAAIGEPARARMLFSLSDGRARTSTELAAVAEVSPATASSHLLRLRTQGLVRVRAQGKHRYYTLEGPEVAALLEALSVVAGGALEAFEPNTPHRLRFARSCYDHVAGALGVLLNDRLRSLGWIADARAGETDYVVTPRGAKEFERLGINVAAARSQRRRFAFGCIDWSERRPHLGGALGAQLLAVALRRKWLAREPYDRALTLTAAGRRELRARLQLAAEDFEPVADRPFTNRGTP